MKQLLDPAVAQLQTVRKIRSDKIEIRKSPCDTDLAGPLKAAGSGTWTDLD
jgi:hypothetical protein